MTFRNSAGWVGTVALAPDGRYVASAHTGNIRIWDRRTGEERHRLIGSQNTMGHIALAFSPDGTTLAASGHGRSLNLWDTVTWAPRRVVEGYSATVDDAAFSPDGQLLATACGDGKIQLWNVPMGSTVWTIQGHQKAASAVAFAPDGHRVASGGEDRAAKVWDVATGAELASFSGHFKPVHDVAFSPDGTTIASVGGDYRGPNAAEVKLWDSQNGQETGNLVGHTSLVNAVAFFPGGRRIATAGDDRTIKLWDSVTGEEVFTLRGPTSGVLSLAISGDGRQIVSGSIDHSAKTWSTATPDPDMAAELSLRRAAVERVQALLAKHLLKADVLDAIKAEKTLSPPLRAAALEIAENRTENASGLYQAGSLAILRPGGRADDYRQAVRRLKAACQVVVDDPERLVEYKRALALAYYRAGQPAQAIETIHALTADRVAPDPGAGHASTDAAPARSSPGPKLSPLDLAVTAMASWQLGDTVHSRAALGQLRKLANTDTWASDQQAQVLFREAEEVVGAPR